MALVENGEGQVWPWCVSCAIDVLTDSGILDVAITLPALAREMHRHSTALQTLSERYLELLQEQSHDKVS